MYNFSQTCQVLKSAVPMKDVSKYQLISEKEASDVYGITCKVKENYQRWVSRIKKPKPLICKGCCEIDNFTGNQLLRIFHDVIDQKNKEGNYCYEPGNFLYFSKNRNFCAAIMFTKTKIMITTPSPTSAVKSDFDKSDKRKYVFLYTKLFDDRKVEHFRKARNKYKSYYKKEIVEAFRKEATEKFTLFLATQVSDFDLFPFGNPFLALLINVAHNISRRGDSKSSALQPLDVDVPFAACVRLAFCKEMIGKVTDLFGDVKFQHNYAHKQSKCIQDTARTLIESAILPVEDGMWSVDEVKKVAREVKEFYKVNQTNQKMSSNSYATKKQSHVTRTMSKTVRSGKPLPISIMAQYDTIFRNLRKNFVTIGLVSSSSYGEVRKRCVQHRRQNEPKKFTEEILDGVLFF